MRAFEIGVVMPLAQYGADRVTPRWSEFRDMARRAEAVGFDTVWTPDELLWRPEGEGGRGRLGWRLDGRRGRRVNLDREFGTWVLSALHRNAGIIAKTRTGGSSPGRDRHRRRWRPATRAGV